MMGIYHEIRAALAGANTQQELRDIHKELLESDELLNAARERRRFHNKIKKEVERELIDKLDAPWVDEAKRWKHGEKVYFGKADNLSYMSFTSLKMTKAYEIKSGEWCRVWEYQPRKKILWLCQPGKACEYKNVIDHAFRPSTIRRCEISRVEPRLRKEGWR